MAKRRSVFKVETVGDCYVGKSAPFDATEMAVIFLANRQSLWLNFVSTQS